MKRATIAVALSLLVSACSLLTDLGGFSGGAGTDGGSPADSDATGDAAADTSLADAATPNDAAGALDCPGTHFFCTNFDQHVLSDEWDVVTPGNGTVDRNMGAAFSMPYSLLVAHPSGILTTAPVVAKTLPALGIGGLRCRFQYRRDVVESAGVVVVLTIDFNTATAEHLFVEIKDGQTAGRVYLAATQADGVILDDFPTVPTFSTALGTWASVDWTVDLRALRSTLASEKKLIDQRPIPHFDAIRVTSVKLTLGLGNFNAMPPSSTWQVRYDDLVCDALP